MDADTEHEQETGAPSRRGAAAAGEIAQHLRSADERLVAFVRERPLVALGAAAALGYLVGRAFSRFA